MVNQLLLNETFIYSYIIQIKNILNSKDNFVKDKRY